MMIYKIVEKIKALKINTVFKFAVVMLVLIACIPTKVDASHLIGGEITYDCLGNDRYRISLTVYRDCYTTNPLAVFDSPAYVGFFDGAGQNLVTNIGDGGVRAVFRMPDDTLTTRITSECFIVGQEVCVHRATYSFVITLPYRPDGYVIAHQRCCRNGSINNIVDPLNTGMTIFTKLSPAALSACSDSPVFQSWPPIYVCTGESVNFDHSANSDSRDSLVYRMVTPVLGATRAEPRPERPSAPLDEPITWQMPFSQNDMLGNPSDPLRIDAQTGRLSGTPQVVGQYLVGVMVEQYRDGVLLSQTRRDFQYNVRQCGEQTKAAFTAPSSVCDSTSVTFLNESDNALNYKWFFNFPDTSSNFTSTEENPTFTYPDTGLYTVALIAYKDTICIDTAFQQIRITTTTINADFEVSKEDCEQAQVIRLIDTSTDTVNAIIAWEWIVTVGGEIYQFTEQNPQFTLNTFGEGQITLTVTAGNGCSSTITKNVIFVDLSDDNIERFHEVCSGDSVELNPDFNPNITYFWTPSDFLDNPNAPNPTATPTDTIVYSVILKDNLTGCELTIDDILVNVLPSPIVIPQDAFTESCVDTIVLVLEVDPDADYTFSWEPAENILEGGDGPTPTVTVIYGIDSIFTYTVTDPQTGCKNIGEIKVEFINLEFPDVSPVDAIAEACIDTINIELEVNNPLGNYIYSWEPAENIISGGDGPNPLVRVVAGIDTVFTFVVRDAVTGCETTGELNIEFIDLEFPDVTFDSDIDANCRDTIQLEVINNNPDMDLTWSWTAVNGTIVSMGDTPTPVVSINSGPSATFSFTATNSDGCEVKGDIKVVVDEDDLNLNFEHILDCETGTVIFSSIGNGNNFTWDFGHDNATATGNPVTYTYPESGVYTVTLSSNGLCSGSISRDITITIFDFDTDLTQIKCDGPGEIELNPNGDPTLDYDWDIDPPSNLYNPTVFVTETTTFIGSVSDPANPNCRAVIRVLVIVSPPIQLTTSDDIEICGDGSDVTLTASSEGLGVIYDWLDNGASIGTGPVIIVNPTQSTVITVVATDENGCVETETISISVREVEIRVEDPKDLYCANDTLNLILIAEEPNLISSITWAPASNIIAGQGEEVATVFIMNNETATFTVTVVYSDGCIREVSTTLDVSIFDPVVMATAEPNEIIRGQTTDLFTPFNPNYTYLWSPSDFIEDGMETTNNPTATPANTTTFTVTVTNEDGCTASASVEVKVIIPICEEPYIFIPTAFSPNNDSNNDVFLVKGEYIDNLELVIYDRWGREVFKTTDLNHGWDGRVNGEILTPDVYGYYVRIECRGGEEITRQGNVTILQ